MYFGLTLVQHVCAGYTPFSLGAFINIFISILLISKKEHMPNDLQY